MKKLYFMAFLVPFFCVFSHAQLTCPNSIKTSAGSTPSTPTFVLENGQGCIGWPLTITVDGALTYNFVSCSGVNLKYAIDSGTPPSTYEMSVDFGGGTVCAYDASGSITILSDEEFFKKNISILPNPSSGILKINLDGKIIPERVSLYTVVGKKVYEVNGQSEYDISGIPSGIYILKVESINRIFVKKIVKQ
ncbi:T9SS type A sorting domain-containing protein [Seonamhaeicola maritimus]|uniref:T9SS type A sorting domain-containing protein n=1 Tax=Seonamhaeicola maritimus TaxID=2591822 RepID=UPI0024951256|nr:T9SS type A sorting domain-containing protein [Seonamhaeicola maritimus]